MHRQDIHNKAKDRSFAFDVGENYCDNIALSSRNTNTRVSNVSTNLHYDALSDKFNLCRVTLQITKLKYVQTAILEISQNPKVHGCWDHYNVVKS